MGGPRILILRTSAMGDIVHSLPVLTALRREMPAARIGWLIEGVFAPLLEGHPALDSLIPVRLRVWRKRPFAARTLREVGTFLRALDRFSAEIVLDLMGNHKAGILGALTLADRRIGLGWRFRREPSSAVWNSLGVEPRGTHAVDRCLSVLDGLDLAPAPADFGGADLCGGMAAAQGEAPFAVVLPGAGWGNKRYPPRSWGRVAALVGRATGIATRVVSGPGEEALAREVCRAAAGWAETEDAAGLAALAAVLRGARLALGGDTGPVHLAHALGTPTLCLMGPTDPRRSGLYRAPDRCLWTALPCSFCHRRLPGARACLLEIPPEAVAERAIGLLRSPC